MKVYLPTHFENLTLPPYDIHIESGVVLFGYYSDGSPAIQIMDHAEGLYSVPTVNLEDYHLHPAVGNVFIKDYSESEGIQKFLQNLGVVGEPIRTVEFGPYDAKAYECPVLVEKGE